jgi:hypothetical protein
MEFKGDEANACRLALHVLGYSEPGVGRFFPTAGLVSSISVPNPPLFVYLVAVPLAVVRSPLAPAACIAVDFWMCTQGIAYLLVEVVLSRPRKRQEAPPVNTQGRPPFAGGTCRARSPSTGLSWLRR